MPLEKSSERPPIDCKERLALTATAACFPEDLRRRWDVAYAKGFQTGIKDAIRKLVPEVLDTADLPGEKAAKIAWQFLRIMTRIKASNERMLTSEEATKIRAILLLKDSLGIPDDQFCEKGVEYVALARRALAAYDARS
jgi:hypothetical protein